MLPIKPPKLITDATQDASSGLILPDERGVLSETNKGIFGLGQPQATPYEMIRRFTGIYSNKGFAFSFDFKLVVFFFYNYPLQRESTDFVHLALA